MTACVQIFGSSPDFEPVGELEAIPTNTPVLTTNAIEWSKTLGDGVIYMSDGYLREDYLDFRRKYYDSPKFNREVAAMSAPPGPPKPPEPSPGPGDPMPVECAGKEPQSDTGCTCRTKFKHVPRGMHCQLP